MKLAIVRWAGIGLIGIGLVGCAAGSGGGLPETGPAPMTCDADPAQYHIGNDATQAMGAAILKDSGARTLRWGAPNAAWTMDYRQDRVNVRYDGQMKIVEITCG